MGAFVEPLKNDFLPKERIQTLWMLLGAVGFVLLIACVNVANLLLSKGTTRYKEVAVRTSLGASRANIFAQFLTESLVLALIGGLLGVGVGALCLRGLIAIMPPGTLPSEADLSLNLPILLFSLAASTLAGLLFGCLPAWYATRVDPGEALKEADALHPAPAVIACARYWSSASSRWRLRCSPARAWPFTASGTSPASISA